MRQVTSSTRHQALACFLKKGTCVIVKDEKTLNLFKDIGQIVADCLLYMARSMQPGMSTLELDNIGRNFLSKYGADSAPEVMYKFPGATCISVNEQAAHGVPNQRVILKEGDMVNIDVSARKNAVFADTGGTFFIGQGPKKLRRLCDLSLQSLNDCLECVKAGEKINIIGKTIEGLANANGYSVIRNLGSHGVGRSLHEEPKFIPGYYDPKDRRKLEKGHVITIEPFICTGGGWVDELEDGWTLVNKEGHYSAQYEHTMIITEEQPVIVTLPSHGEPFKI